MLHDQRWETPLVRGILIERADGTDYQDQHKKMFRYDNRQSTSLQNQLKSLPDSGINIHAGQ
jgi:hypothetical protein